MILCSAPGATGPHYPNAKTGDIIFFNATPWTESIGEEINGDNAIAQVGPGQSVLIPQAKVASTLTPYADMAVRYDGYYTDFDAVLTHGSAPGVQSCQAGDDGYLSSGLGCIVQTPNVAAGEDGPTQISMWNAEGSRQSDPLNFDATAAGAMSVAAVHPQPWTVAEGYALPEDGMRHELLDGTLLASPPPSVVHQLAAARLRSALAAAAPSDVEILEAVGVALPAGLLVPDVVVARSAAVYAATGELQAADVLAVAEIVSPESADRRWKAEAYAEAGIDVYVRVELDAPEVIVQRLLGGTYTVDAVARGTTRTELAVPFAVALAAADLVGPAR